MKTHVDKIYGQYCVWEVPEDAGNQLLESFSIGLNGEVVAKQKAEVFKDAFERGYNRAVLDIQEKISSNFGLTKGD